MDKKSKILFIAVSAVIALLIFASFWRIVILQDFKADLSSLQE